MVQSSCKPTSVAAAAKAGLDTVLDKWRRVAAETCKPGYFGDIQFTLRIRDGVPHTSIVNRTESELVTNANANTT